VVELDIPNEEWDKATLLNYEREMLGLYVSDHPLLGVEGVLRSNSDISISELADEENGVDRTVTIAGLITGIQRKVSRQGASWAIVTVEDLEGAIDVMFFSNTYNQYAMSLVEDRVVKIRGRVDWREEQLRFTALEMSPIDLTTGPIGPFTLSVQENQLTPPVIERIKEALRAHPGKREVQLVVSDKGKTTTHKLGFHVTSSPSLHADLKAILGPECVRN
jgi:DNA polymerase-3 subunit alpha